MPDNGAPAWAEAMAYLAEHGVGWPRIAKRRLGELLAEGDELAAGQLSQVVELLARFHFPGTPH
jgi:hypothetical protein